MRKQTMQSAVELMKNLELKNTLDSQTKTTNQDRLTQARLNGLTETNLICGSHGDTLHHVAFLDDKAIRKTCSECGKEHAIRKEKEAQQSKQREESEELRRLFRMSGIPKRFQKKMLWNYIPNNDGAKKVHRVCERYSEKFDDRFENGGGLILCGKPGTGKTHLAAGIGLEALADKYRVEYNSAINIIREIRNSYKKDAQKTESELIERFVNIDLLIIDEVGVQYGTDSEKIILFDVINGRYNNVKPTIIISNLNLTELKGFIGERVVDRMREGGGAVLSFDWESARK